jgi:hypothetical protein
VRRFRVYEEAPGFHPSPGERTKRLKLGYDEPLSTFPFQFNLRRYTLGIKMQRVAELALGTKADVDWTTGFVDCTALGYTAGQPTSAAAIALADEGYYALACRDHGDRIFDVLGRATNRPTSVYRLTELPIQSCGQSVSASHGKAGARLNAHTELRAKRQRSARESIYRNRPVASNRYTLATPSNTREASLLQLRERDRDASACIRRHQAFAPPPVLAS